MAITVDQIDLWRQEPTETQILEFKQARNQLPQETIYEYCVAIGNEGGGFMLLGIEDKKPHIVKGSNAVDNPIGMSEKIFGKLKFRVDIEAVMHPDGRVVVFSIPPCPDGHPFHLDGKYLMRIGQSVQPMSPERLKKLMSKRPPDWLEEHTKNRLGAGRVLSLLDVPTFSKLLNISIPSTVEGMMSLLLGETLIDQDEQEGESYSIRRMGALLLAKDLKQFPEIYRKAPRVSVYRGANKLTDPIDYKVGELGYAVAFQGLVRFVNTHIPHREIIEDGLRKSVNIIPSIIVRELLANALVHQDLTITGTSVVVDIFDNRLEISNPGEPIVPLDRLVDQVRSRNERLADLMRRMGICEERGSGIDKVIASVESLLLPAPSFRAQDNRTIFTVYGPRSFEAMDREDRVRACHQHCCLKFEMTERMTNQSLRARFKLPESKTYLASQVITNTVEAQLVKLDPGVGPSKKLACYVPHWVRTPILSVSGGLP